MKPPWTVSSIPNALVTFLRPAKPGTSYRVLMFTASDCVSGDIDGSPSKRHLRFAHRGHSASFLFCASAAISCCTSARLNECQEYSVHVCLRFREWDIEKGL